MIRTKFIQTNAYQAETWELLISIFYFIYKALLDKLSSAIQVTTVDSKQQQLAAV